MKAKIESITAILNKINEGLKCYNFRDAVKKDPVTFETILCCYNIFDWDYDSFTQALVPTFSDDGINTKRLVVTTFKCFLDFLETCNFDGMLTWYVFTISSLWTKV